MWIPRYIDMNPHFSQNILNKGIFQMWIHHYIDMNPHKSESESARYSIHLRKSITWSACGNGQKEKHEGKQDER